MENENMDNCYYHPDRVSFTQCHRCKHNICKEDSMEDKHYADSTYFCPLCQVDQEKLVLIARIRNK